MELTNSQLLLLAAFNEAKIKKREAAVLLSLLEKQEIEIILDQLDNIVDSKKRLPTEQEIMEILWPILKMKAKEQNNHNTSE